MVLGATCLATLRASRASSELGRWASVRFDISLPIAAIFPAMGGNQTYKNKPISKLIPKKQPHIIDDYMRPNRCFTQLGFVDVVEIISYGY